MNEMWLKQTTDRKVLLSSMMLYMPCFESLCDGEGLLYILSWDDEMAVMHSMTNTMLSLTTALVQVSNGIVKCNT